VPYRLLGVPEYSEVRGVVCMGMEVHRRCILSVPSRVRTASWLNLKIKGVPISRCKNWHVYNQDERNGDTKIPAMREQMTRAILGLSIDSPADWLCTIECRGPITDPFRAQENLHANMYYLYPNGYIDVLTGCASVRENATPMGEDKYLVTCDGNGYASTGDAVQCTAQAANEICNP